MPVSCCIVGCPTIVSANHANLLRAFPSKKSPEYAVWRKACTESESHINKLRNPLICPIHFALYPDSRIQLGRDVGEIPEHFLTAKEIKFLNEQWQSINRLVAEWLDLTQKCSPEIVVNSNMLKSKAREVADVLKLHRFDVDFGWLHSFEVFLNLNGIRHCWKEKRGSLKNSNQFLADTEQDLIVDSVTEMAAGNKEPTESLNQQWDSINQLVAEWMNLTQQNNPGLVVNGNMLQAKARQVASVMKINPVYVNFGWLQGFELYLSVNGLQHYWKDKSESFMTETGQNSRDSSHFNVKPVEDAYSPAAIKTYKEALEKVELLEDYVRRMQNSNALELIEHMQGILINTPD